MNFAPRPSRSRGRGFRGARRGTGGHIPRGRGRGGFSASRSPSRSYPPTHSSTRSSYDQSYPSSSTRRYEGGSEKYYSQTSSSARPDFRSKYPRTVSPDYHHESSYHTSEYPKKKYHTDYSHYDDEASMSRSSSGGRYHTEDRYERRDYSEPSSSERHLSASTRDVYDEGIPPPPPLLSQEYMPAPKPLYVKRGRGAPRGRGLVPSRGVSRGGVMKTKIALAAQKKMLLEKIKRSKIATLKLEKAKLELDYSRRPPVHVRELPLNDDSPSDEEPYHGRERYDDPVDDRRLSPRKPRPEPRVKTFIPLNCPHCKENYKTFHQYDMHLQGRPHLFAMSKLTLRSKQQVIKMRAVQRQQQNEIEEKPDPEEPLTSFTKFCPICKLNYRQSKLAHSRSKAHLDMKKYLLPSCSYCKLAFKSRRMYEQHICSLEHLKMAFYKEKKRRPKEDEDEVGEIDEEAFNLPEGFMVVDSVGEEDEVETILGEDRIRTVEALFCELCQKFLPRLDDTHKAKVVHCRSYLHKKNYNADAKEKARKRSLERKESTEKKERTDSEPKSDEEKQDEEMAQVKETKTSEGSTSVKDDVDLEEDEALWRDVNHDLGELLKDRVDEDESLSNEGAE